MLRLQVESLANKIFEAIDEVIDMETSEGVQVYNELLKTLNRHHPDYMVPPKVVPPGKVE